MIFSGITDPKCKHNYIARRQKEILGNNMSEELSGQKNMAGK